MSEILNGAINAWRKSRGLPPVDLAGNVLPVAPKVAKPPAFHRPKKVGTHVGAPKKALPDHERARARALREARQAQNQATRQADQDAAFKAYLVGTGSRQMGETPLHPFMKGKKKG